MRETIIAQECDDGRHFHVMSGMLTDHREVQASESFAERRRWIILKNSVEEVIGFVILFWLSKSKATSRALVLEKHVRHPNGKYVYPGRQR